MLDAAKLDEALDRLTPDELLELSRSLASVRMTQRAASRAQQIEMAREELIPFAQITMPDLSNRQDPYATRYLPSRHHRALAAALEKVESGEWPRLIITMPPRHGKSELASKRAVAWFLGRDPYRQVIFATYNEDLAGDTGREIRDILQSDEFSLVFPDCKIAKGSSSVDRIKTSFGGAVYLAGRGGAITGRGCDMAVIDDPIKGRSEAESQAIRNQLWDWFNDDVYSRLLSDTGRIVIIMTRWHEDDLVGRLTDPANQHYDADEAAHWRILDLPALAREDDPLGRQVGAPLWPEKFSREYLERLRGRNPRGFASLYQCRPTPDDGDFFRADWLRGYKDPSELPKELRWYAASDHAVGLKQSNDRSCLGCGGVDENGVLWIPPDIDWGRWDTEKVVELMLEQMRRHRPLIWWAENEHIGRSIGPFLRKRMVSTGIYAAIEPRTPAKDKSTRAQAVRAMLSMGMVRFPTFATWWEDARGELLKFPNGTHDDFVDWLAHLGAGVDRMVGARRQAEPTDEIAAAEPRTWRWLKRLSDAQKKTVMSPFKGW